MAAARFMRTLTRILEPCGASIVQTVAAQSFHTDVVTRIGSKSAHKSAANKGPHAQSGTADPTTDHNLSIRPRHHGNPLHIPKV